MVGFAEALPFFTKLKKLDLSENNLSDEGTKILANGLASFVTRHQSSTALKNRRQSPCEISSAQDIDM